MTEKTGIFHKIKDLITKNIGNPSGGIVNTVLSLVKDKTRDSDDSFIHEKVKKGVAISSKRVLNLGVTGSILIIAGADIVANGITWLNIGLALVGALYSLGMAFLTAYTEKNKRQ